MLTCIKEGRWGKFILILLPCGRSLPGAALQPIVDLGDLARGTYWIRIARARHAPHPFTAPFRRTPDGGKPPLPSPARVCAAEKADRNHLEKYGRVRKPGSIEAAQT